MIITIIKFKTSRLLYWFRINLLIIKMSLQNVNLKAKHHLDIEYIFLLNIFSTETSHPAK